MGRSCGEREGFVAAAARGAREAARHSEGFAAASGAFVAVLPFPDDVDFFFFALFAGLGLAGAGGLDGSLLSTRAGADNG